jgi:hypothetical protein
MKAEIKKDGNIWITTQSIAEGFAMQHLLGRSIDGSRDNVCDCCHRCVGNLTISVDGDPGLLGIRFIWRISRNMSGLNVWRSTGYFAIRVILMTLPFSIRIERLAATTKRI